MSKIANVNSLSTNFTKWSNILKQFVGNLATNYLSVFDHFLKLALKQLKTLKKIACFDMKTFQFLHLIVFLFFISFFTQDLQILKPVIQPLTVKECSKFCFQLLVHSRFCISESDLYIYVCMCLYICVYALLSLCLSF